MAATRRRRRAALDIWPGFVDALATLLILIIFVLMVFMIAQFYLNEALSGRDEALQRLNRQIAELADMLQLERSETTQLRQTLAQLSAELQTSIETRDHLGDQLLSTVSERDLLATALAEMTAASEANSARALALAAELAARTAETESQAAALETTAEEIAALAERIAALGVRAEELEAAVRAARGETAERTETLRAEREISAEALAQVELLNRQLGALRRQIAMLNQALEASEALATEQTVQIADLGQRLNLALAGKVQELAHYRSEFFGRLREVLGNRRDIRVVGDRFVFQSEVLFDSGSAELAEEGRIQIAALTETLVEIAAQIPPDINWILRVDGHTDRIPISTPLYPSNWELSTGRATAVVKFMIEQGIPPSRLAATGFGEFQPLDAASDEFAYRRNRRIEFKLTQR